jgi:hypothetical protein
LIQRKAGEIVEHDARARGIEKAVTVIIGTRDKDGKWVEGGALGELSRPPSQAPNLPRLTQGVLS